MNTITAEVSFDYQGKHYHLTSIINIDKIINHENIFQSIYLQLAKENNIGLYSYQLEIMMDQEIVFSNPSKTIKPYFNNNELDIQKLKLEYKTIPMDKLNDIAKEILNIDDLSKHIDIKNALIKAYQLSS